MSEQVNELRAMFLQARALPAGAERARYLDAACGNRPELRRRLEELLRAAEGSGDLLSKDALGGDMNCGLPPVVESPGMVVGRYKLLEQIGEGGFGVVFMAEQAEPIRRRVALKVVKPGMDTRQVIARFEAERQALALMDHPNIARVFDAGTTDSGRPYFVMELVAGVPMTRFCDANDLTTPERLKLFQTVCEAVQHAHQKGIIHRDLKPSNILVSLHDGKPVAKVIDFGTAKALEHPLTEKTLFTAYGKLIGTPQYMSPEQAELSGLGVDTRTDVYSLGVLLYELLTGTTPFEAERLRGAAFDEMLRIIRQEEPPRPSTRISTLGERATEIARQRQVEPGLLRRSLHGDLDCIVMKCLEKERGRRYQAAHALAEDLQRHLLHQPVLASPPGAAYRVRKFIRRHRVGVSLAAAVAGALLVGGIAAVAGFLQANRARERAQEQNAIAEAVKTFLQEDLLGQASPWAEPDRDVKLRTVLDRAADKVGTRFQDKPMVEAEIRRTLLAAYHDLGEYSNARVHLDRVLEIYQPRLPPDDPKLLKVQKWAAVLLYSEGRPRQAADLLAQILPHCRRVFGQINEDTLEVQEMLAGIYCEGGMLIEEGRRLMQEAAALRVQSAAPEATPLPNTIEGQAHVSWDRGKLDEAQKMFEEALALRKPSSGLEHPKTLKLMFNLARIYSEQGKLEQARRLFEEVEAVRSRVFGPEHRVTLGTKALIAGTYAWQGKLPEARKQAEEVLALLQRILGPEHPNTVWVMDLLGRVYCDQGNLDEARAILENAVAIRRRDFGPDDWNTACSMQALAATYQRQGNMVEARKLYSEILPVQRRVLGSIHPATLVEINNLAWMLATHADPEVRDAQGAVRLAEEAVEATSRTNHFYLDTLAAAYAEAGQFTNAVIVQKEAIAKLTIPSWATAYTSRQRLYEAGYRYSEARTLNSLANRKGSQGQWTEALALLDQLMRLQPDDQWHLYRAHAAALISGQRDRARELAAEMLRRFGNSEDVGICERVAKSLLLSSDRPADVEAAFALASRACQTAPNSWWNQIVKAIAEYRLAHYAEAEELTGQLCKVGGTDVACLAGYFCAMASHQQGKAAAARTLLDEANQRFATLFSAGELGDRWDEPCRILVARAEAERLIHGREVSAPVTRESLERAREKWNPVRELLVKAASLGKQANWSESREAYLRALDDPAFLWGAAEQQSEAQCLALQMAVVFLRAGDLPNHERVCRLVLGKSGGTPSGRMADIYAKTCLMNGKALPPDLMQQAQSLTRSAAEVVGISDCSASWWACQRAGMAEYYVGNYAKALQLLKHAERCDDGYGGKIACRGGAMVFRAMALKQLGQAEEACRILAQAEELLRDPIQTRSQASWWDLGICELALEQARHLIVKEPAPFSPGSN